MKEFDLEKALAGSRIVTKEGKEVKSLSFMPDLTEDEFKLVGVVGGEMYRWTTEGISVDEDDAYDLYLASERCEAWINVYRNSKGGVEFGNKIYRSSTDAEDSGKSGINKYVCTTYITWED
jgi:hypothetical protein